MQIVVMIQDKFIEDADVGTDLDTTSPKKGDVIDILPDDSDLGGEVYTSPLWAIIQAPILQTHADTLTMGGAPLVNPDPTAAYPFRAYSLDVDALGLVPAQPLNKSVKLETQPKDTQCPQVTLSNDDIVNNTIQKNG